MPELFDALCDRVTDVFMALPELPSKAPEPGVIVNSFSTVLDAAEVVVENTPPDETIRVINDVMQGDEEFCLVTDIVFDAPLLTPRQAISRILTHVVTSRLQMDPAIVERERSNSRTSDMHMQR